MALGRWFFSRVDKLIYLFGIGLFIFILSKIDFGYYLSLLNQIDIIYIVGAIFLGLPIIMIRSFRWKMILSTMGISYSFKDSFLAYLSSIYIGSFTPARIGEFSKVYYLKSDGHPLVPGIVSVFLDRLSDLLFLLIVCLASFFYFTSYLDSSSVIFFSLVILIVLILLIFIVYKKGIYKSVLKKIFFGLTPKKYRKNANLVFSDFVERFKQFKLNDYLVISFLTFFSWLLSFVMSWWIVKAMNLDYLGFIYTAIVLALSMLISLVPVSIYGIGTRDALVILLFGLKDVAAEKAIIFSMLLLLITVATTIFGLVAWILKPIKLKDLRK
ncbi:MAG: hypothetical protein CMI53_03275 [Parcubacteria group bacterium]|nr:hypothetical protein [Parcubacteria group bacterium]|tara:strand:- start:45 stop:1025 length:981 start_codon:yes stop_codon:yes gene_type:complete